MPLSRAFCLSRICLFFATILPAGAAVVNATWNSPTDVPVTASSYTATGNTVDFTLNFAPATGTNLTVVNNTGLPFISGAFDNLAQGQAVVLSYNGVTYNYVAVYYGGTGNDLVLVWAANRAFGWGSNDSGRIGDGTTTQRNVMVPVTATGVLAGKTIVSLAQGDRHSLALCTDGTLAAWGYNYYGQLGNNSSTSSSVPVAVNTTSGVSALADKTIVAVAAGSYYSLALCSDGTVAAWGYNYYGQLGDNTTTNRSVPVAVNTLSGVSALYGKSVVTLAAGNYHNLALCSDGTVAAWGYNSSGQLGDNTATTRSVPVIVNNVSGVSALYGKTVTALAAGTYHSLAMCSDGTTAAWGFNSYGQVGDSSLTSRKVPVAVNTASGVSALFGRSVAAIAAGSNYSMALCSDGGVVAWGYNSYGQMGDKSTTTRYAPVAVNTASGISALSGRIVVAIAVGGYNNSTSRALCSDNALVSWGDGGYGDLGNNGTSSSNVPVLVSTGPPLVGEKFVGSLSGTTAETLIVVAEPPSGVTTLAATSVAGSSAVLNGVVSTFNSTVSVSFDYGTTTAYGTTISATPATVSGNIPVNVTAALTGLLPLTTYHFRINDGDFVGNDLTFTTPNNDARLSGVSISEGSLSPAFVSSTLNYTDLVDTSTMAVAFTPSLSDSNATLTLNGVSITPDIAYMVSLGYGDNLVHLIVTAQDGVVTQDYVFNIQRPQPTTISASYATGAEVPLTTNGLTATGRVVNFALNYAPATGANLTVVNNTGLGFISGTFDNLSQGQAVALSYNGVTYNYVATYYGGTGNDLVLVWAASRVFGWGSNNYGRIGDGTTTQRNLMVPVTANSVLSGKTVVSLVQGGSHSLALCADGTVAAWGYNGYGQLGNNSTTTSYVPVAVNTTSGVSALAGKTVVAVAAGSYHSLALCSDGTVAAWGSNSNGILGDNTTVNRSVPVAVNAASGVSALYGRTVVALAAGDSHSLALCSDGTVVAWGSNSYGQLGDTTTTSRSVPTLVNTASGLSALSGKTVATLAAGASHSLALCTDGTLVSWGYNYSGQLGDNTTTQRLIPVGVNTTSGISALSGRSVTAIAAGSYYNLALCADGGVVAWGENSFVQLGDKSTTTRKVPVAVNTASGVSALYGRTVVAIAAGGYNDCTSRALCSDGTLAVWGDGGYGDLGNNSTTNSNVPVLVSTSPLLAGESLASPLNRSTAAATLVLVAEPLPGVSTLAATSVVGTSAVFNGRVTTNNSTVSVSFDYGTTTAYGSSIPATPATVSGNATTLVSAVPTGLLPLTTYHYRVNDGAYVGADTTFTTPNNDARLSSLTVSTGSLSPAFASGTLNYTDTVEMTTTAATFTPTLSDSQATLTLNGVSSNSGSMNPVNLSYGDNLLHLVVTAQDGAAKQDYVLNIVRPQPITIAAAYTTGSEVPLATNGITATGRTVNLSLNHAPTTGASLMVINNTGLNFIYGTFNNLAQGQAVDLSYNGITYHFVAHYYGGTGNDLVLMWANNRIFSWGGNDSGQLGNGTGVSASQPATVSSSGVLAGRMVVAVASGDSHTLALCLDGTLAAWGDNTYGQLGDNTTMQRNVPVAVNTDSGISALFGKTVVAIAASGSHSLALCSDGTAVAWGDNPYGQLGDNTTTSRKVPVAVNTASGVSALAGKSVAALATGYYHSLAVCTDGTIVAWGENSYGQLGDGTNTGRRVPVAVSTASGVSALSGRSVVAMTAGYAHSLVLCSDGTVAAWGYNGYGQLGDGTTNNRNMPVVISTASGVSALYGKTVTALTAGYYHSMALCTDGTLAAWGYNSSGQLGDNTSTHRFSPVSVSTASGVSALNGRTVTAIALGNTHSLALCSDGALAAWGMGLSYQLGDGTRTSRQVPVLVGTGALTTGEKWSMLAGSFHAASNSLAVAAAPAYATVTTQTASPLGGTSATLNGTAVAGGGSLDVSFEYGTTTSYGSSISVGTPVTGSAATPANASISGLLPGTTYHYRINGLSGGTTLHGADLTFTTLRNNASLAGLVPGSGVLSPAFAPGTTAYTVSVPYGTTFMTLTPVLADVGGSVQVNGADLPSGSASWPINLVEGSNTLTVTAIAQDGTTMKSYTLAVTRASGPSLSALALDSGSLSPAFESSATRYAVNVPTDTSTITLTPTLADATCTLTVNGAAVTSGSAAGPVSLVYGDNLIAIAVSAQDGTTVKTYNVNVIRAIPAVFSVVFSAVFDPGGAFPLTISGLTATGTTLNLALNFAPNVGTNFTVVRNVSTAPITGTFTNLAPGQLVELTYNGTTYHFTADYYGGTGNDLVLRWTDLRATASGNNYSYQLGVNSQYNQGAQPVVMPGMLKLKRLRAVAAGGAHSLALFWDGTLAAWGDDSYGQLGTSPSAYPSYAAAILPSAALTGKTVVSISAGGTHSLALCSDGAIAAWGDQSHGQLGVDGGSTSGSGPTLVSTTSGLSALAGRTAVAISAGAQHNLALCSDGTVVAWGDNTYGQVGNFNQTTVLTPQALDASSSTSALYGKTIVAIAAGGQHSLVLCSDGTVLAWGDNTYGQLGDTTNTARRIPVAVSTANGISALYGKTVISIAAGGSHSLALCSDGTVAAWGLNSYGQLGDDSGGGRRGSEYGTNRSAPVQVLPDYSRGFYGKTMTSIAAGAMHSIATCSDGTLAFWGSNMEGQSGLYFDGQTLAYPAAVQVPGVGGGYNTACTVGVFSGPTSRHNLELVASPPPNFVTTSPAADLGYAVYLQGLVSYSFGPGDGDVPVFFEYGPTTAYGTTVFVTNFSPYQFSVYKSVTGLAPGTYHYRLNVASYSGQDVIFTFLSPQQNWRQQNFGDAANTGTAADTADYDGDGIPNLLEYALNLSPKAASKLPATTTTNGTNFEYTYTRSTAAVNAGTTFTVEWSDTLAAGSWSSIGVIQTVLSDDGTTQQVKAVIAINAAKAKFVHLSVTAPP